MYASSKPMGSLYPAPYRLKDVGSLNDLRPAVNLKRSKTSVNPTSTQLLYRSASMQAVTRSYSTAPQFRQYVARYRQADIPLPGSAATNSRYRRLKPGGGHGGRAEAMDQFCEFQAAPSFDLPNMDVLKRAADGGKLDLSRDSWDEEHKYSSVMFEGEDGKTTVQASRLLLRDSEASSSENIRYQGMDIVTNNKDRNRKPDVNNNNNNNNRARQQSQMRSYYSSWEDLLEKSEVANRSNLLNRRHFGSTESINSTSSDISRQQQQQQQQQPAYEYQQHELKQVAGHHLQLHAVHNQTYQTNSTLETCMESDENDVEEEDSIQLYDVPRSVSTLKKSNSRVSSSGKLCLRVESFKEKKNSSGTQTESSTLQDRAVAGAAEDQNYRYVGHFQKAQMRHVR